MGTGGLSLRSVTWNQGAADATVSFKPAQPDQPGQLQLRRGAAQMDVPAWRTPTSRPGQIQGGAGTLELHFDGTLSQAADFTLESGMAHVVIYSGGNPVQLTADTNVAAKVQSDWTQSGTVYSSPEVAAASGPQITVHATVALGSLELKTGK